MSNDWTVVTNDGKVQKCILKAGQGDTPKDNHLVSVHYAIFVKGEHTPFDSTRERNVPFTFTLNRGQALKAFDLVVATMKVGELARAECGCEYGFDKQGRAPSVPKEATLQFDIELLHTWEPSDPSKKQFAMALAEKELGNTLFKEGQTEAAMTAYTKARDYLEGLPECNEHHDTLVSVLANIGACHLTLCHWDMTIETCKQVLEKDPGHIKSYVRMGKACLGNKDYRTGISHVKKGLEMDPRNDGLQVILGELQKKTTAQKAAFGKMFSR